MAGQSHFLRENRNRMIARGRRGRHNRPHAEHIQPAPGDSGAGGCDGCGRHPEWQQLQWVMDQVAGWDDGVLGAGERHIGQQRIPDCHLPGGVRDHPGGVFVERGSLTATQGKVGFRSYINGDFLANQASRAAAWHARGAGGTGHRRGNQGAQD